MAVNFFNEDIRFNLPQKRIVKSWLKNVVEHYGFKLKDLNIIFCSDAKILSINKTFLNHNYYTDVITFPYSSEKYISGDIFISIDTVLHNSELFNQSFNRELNRVIVHAVLHLLGFNDKTNEETSLMRTTENYWLDRLNIF